MDILDAVLALPDPRQCAVGVETVARLQKASNALAAHLAVLISRLLETETVNTVREATGSASSEVGRQRRHGTNLKNQDHLLKAALVGSISPEAARIICRYPQSEEELVATAETLGADSVRKRASLLTNRTVRGDAARNRNLRIGETKDGLVSVSGRLTPQVASLLKQGTDAMVIKGRHGTPGQRRHDALAQILKKAAMPTRGGAPITVTYQVTTEGNGSLRNHEGGLTPVSISELDHAACVGTVNHLLQQTNGRAVALVTGRRTFNHHQRHAITIRDGGCVIPGCEIPAAWCEIHHVTPHARGGPTSTDNGAMMCWQHHHNLHNGQWLVTMEDGVPRVRAGPGNARLDADELAGWSRRANVEERPGSSGQGGG